MKLLETQILAALDRGSEPYKWPPSVVRRLPNISMSNVGGACARDLFFTVHEIIEINGVGIKAFPDYSTPRGKRLMQYGYVVENYIYGLFKKAGVVVSGTQEKMTDFGGRLVGKCDGILSWPQRVVIEIKGLNNDNYNRVIQLGMKEVFYNYYVQLNLYCFYLGIDTGAFIIFNKDNSDINVIQIKMDMDLVTEVRLKVKTVLESNSPTKLGPFNRSCQDCGFCPYQDMCDTLPDVTT